MPPDPYAMLRSRGYVVLLVFAAILGVPIAAGAYGFLVLVGRPPDLGLHRPPGRAGLRR